MSRWGVGLVGCGTVGGGTASILTSSAAGLRSRTGTDFPLVAVFDQDYSHARSLSIDPALFCSSLDELLLNPAVDVVVELAGGTGFAKTVVERALDAGKHVVTANKALLATFGPELFARARARGRTIGFEASCAGAIPVVRTLVEDLVANRILGIAGVVNGTCNYILSKMTSEGVDYATALAQAQHLGFAEADPFLDVSGTDSAHKLALLASVAFGAWVDWKEIPLKGLDSVQPSDLQAAHSLGARIKLLARAESVAEGYWFSVEPTVMPLPHPLAALDGPFNGVLVHGDETGFLYFQGRGAGARPTASAVVSDLAGLASGTLPHTHEHYAHWPDRAVRIIPRPAEASRGPWCVFHPDGRAEIIENASRAALQVNGQRVFPWFSPRD